MSNKFKHQAAQKRAAVPQVDLESAKVELSTPVSPPTIDNSDPASTGQSSQAQELAQRLTSLELPITQVDTSETPTNRGFSMYPSRHRQIAKDLAYIEDRNPWEIIEDALEEYVVKRYGEAHKRKQAK